MKELSQIRMAVLDALRGAGIQAMEEIGRAHV